MKLKKLSAYIVVVIPLQRVGDTHCRRLTCYPNLQDAHISNYSGLRRMNKHSFFYCIAILNGQRNIKYSSRLCPPQMPFKILYEHEHTVNDIAVTDTCMSNRLYLQKKTVHVWHET